MTFLRNRMPKPGAFTLIELLVVVSIIALLVSILLPALAKARDSAKRTVCLSNFKAFGVACHMYAGDQRGNLPEAYFISNSRHRLAYHVLLEGKYVEEKSPLWLCPADRDPIVVTKDTDWYPAWTLPAGKFSYHWNAWTGYRVAEGTNGWAEWGVKSYSVNLDSSRTPGLIAIVRDRWEPGYSQTALIWDAATRTKHGPNHMEQGYNLLCGDTHAVWLTRASADGYKWYPENGTTYPLRW